jgi:hypothetical protein
MDTASLMWDETGRDYDHERRELARTAALNDAERLVGQYLYQATSDVDLVNRLALADARLQAVASTRGYPLQDLTGDLTERWQLLFQARAARRQKEAAQRKVTAAAEEAMDAVTASLAAVAAQQNPGVPMVECLRLATEAVRKHADAYPLAYESFGGSHDGPITDRAKNFTPGQLPKALPESASGPAANPGPNGGSGTFDSVHQRLDDLEGRLPAAAASLEPTVAGFYQRLKDWWHGPQEGSDSGGSFHYPPSLAPSSHPAPEQRAPYMTPSNNAASDHVDDAVERHHDEQGRREFSDIMNRLNSDQAEMNHKWDTPREDRFESPSETNQRTKYLEDARNRRADGMDQKMDHLGDSLTPTPPSTPSSGFSHSDRSQITNVPLHNAPAGFSHTETGTGGGQQVLPTDPAAHSFSHPGPAQTPRSAPIVETPLTGPRNRPAPTRVTHPVYPDGNQYRG